MATGALIGLAAGTGVALIGAWVIARRPLPLAARIGPYLGIAGSASARVRDDARHAASARRDIRGSVPGRLALTSAGLGLTFALLAAIGGAAGSAPALGLAAAACTWALGTLSERLAARRRREAVQRQLPMLADLLALGVSAGLPPVDALDTAAATLRGPLAAEVERAVADMRSGSGVDGALQDMAARTGLPAVGRFVESILIAQGLGSPLADVLRAQAADLRVDERRLLMEAAGRKDAAMLVPIVFLVLPSVIAIALYPGVQSLRLVLP